MKDVQVDNCGNIVGLTPITPAAREWIKEHCQTEPWQWMGETLNVEARYAGSIVEGMQADGLTVEQRSDDMAGPDYPDQETTMDPLNHPALWKPTIKTVESHGETYRVFDGTFYGPDTPDEVIRVLHQARKSGRRIRIHTGYTTPKIGPCDTSVPPIGRDWLEESDVEGTVDRSRGPVKVPILLATARSTAGGSILSDCIVKITTTGRSRRTLYQHPAYHAGRITVKRIKRKSEEQTLAAAVLFDGKEHAAFTTREIARRWIARMGLEEATCQG